MDIPRQITTMAKSARDASRTIAGSDTNTRNSAVLNVADSLWQCRSEIIAANRIDVEKARSDGVAQPLIDRLEVGERSVEKMRDGALAVAALPDPIGSLEQVNYRPSGLQVGQMRIPLGVLALIYESRPDATVEVSTLCIKSANACILRGGSEAIRTNTKIALCISEALATSNLPSACVQLVPFTDRAGVGELLKQDEYIDLIVPRGGKSLIERVAQESRIPVLKHLDGVCHVYVDATANLDMAIDIAYNSKVEKFAVCNALETLLVNQHVAGQVLPPLVQKYVDAGVELRGCPRAREIDNSIVEATEQDWREEYLGPTLAIKIVQDIDEAIDHIDMYGSHHTDTIVSSNYDNTQKFLTSVDSATVMVNASTQFADGFEFGLGAEIGISTDKLHARGPVGLEGLTTRKFVVFGHGETRQR